MRPYTHNVAPRYTAGSPALVDEATARKVASEETRAYISAIKGHYGEEEQVKALTHGLTGIVWYTLDRRRHLDFHDCITGECGIIKDGKYIYQGVNDGTTWEYAQDLNKTDICRGIGRAVVEPPAAPRGIAPGSKLWYVPNSSNHIKRPHEVTVMSVGRKWASIAHDPQHGRHVERVLIEEHPNGGHMVDGKNYTSPGMCYVDRAAYEATERVKHHWRLFTSCVDTPNPPPGATVEIIRECRALLFGEDQ